MIRPASVALGVTTLCLLDVTGPLVSPTHLAIYHFSGRASSLFIPVALNFCFVWIVVATVLWLADRSVGLFAVVWSGLGVSLPVVLLKNLSSLLGSKPSHRMVLASVVLPMLAVLAIGLFSRRRLVDFFVRAQELVETILAFSSLVGVVVLVQLAWFGWGANHLNPAPHLHERVVASATFSPHPRVVWILFDELSFQQIEERRFPGLKLPAFDALAAESTVFTHTVPAGNDTAKVIPALFTGVAVDDLGISEDGRLRRLHDVSGWHAFDPHQTVFQDALDRGYGTAVAGWYNPYCRILPEVLDRCFWTYRIPYKGQMAVNRSLLANVFTPVPSVVYTAWHAAFSRSGWSRIDANRSAMHLADYQDLLAAGDAQLNDSGSSFLFLHLPIPHPGGIFDHRRRRFTTGPSSYVDNLALADQYLAHVRQLLEQRGEWDSSVVLVMGDHSWRTRHVWADSNEWTPDDQAASHGGEFDDRPYYLVKMPGQHDAQRVDAPFAALRTRALLDAILDQRVLTPPQLAEWAREPAPK